MDRGVRGRVLGRRFASRPRRIVKTTRRFHLFFPTRGIGTSLLAMAMACLVSALRGQPLRTQEGFAIPQPNHPFVFPRDHGSHPEFKIEWWYLTGHLFDSKNRRFGFQATFFRQAVDPTSTADLAASAATFGYDPVYLAHFALTDVQSDRFYFQERLNRAGWDAS